MNKSEILKTLADILGIDVAEIEKISETAPIADLGMDSIKFIEFIVTIEGKYNIEVFDSDLIFENFATVGSIFSTLDKYFSDVDHVYKCIVTDCDGVLWKGIAGENGSDSAYTDAGTDAFQQVLKSLKNKGIYICLCTKNNGTDIATMFTGNPEMPLKIDDITIIKTDADNKAEEVRNIANELGISLESIIFIDDSEYELGLVNTLIPCITVLKADNGRKSFTEDILKLFGDIPEHGIDRTRLYKEQKEREKIKISAQTVDEYNSQLGTAIICNKITSSDILNEVFAERIAELSNRTNRFNISGKRYTADDIVSIHNDPDYKIYYLSASDIYGDMGIVAAAIICENVIENFMLSCRTFGRGFENVLIEKIKQDSMTDIEGIFVGTDKNKNCRSFYLENGIKIK